MTEAPRRPVQALARIAAGLLLAGSAYGYIRGWPAWLVLAAFLAGPTLLIFIWVYSGRLRRYRFLMGIYAVAGAIGLFEAWEYGRIPDSIAKSIDLPQGAGKPNLYFEYNLPGVMFELFPDHADSLLLRGMQSRFCMDQHSPFRTHPFCEGYTDSEVKTIRDWFEAALAQQPKTNEDLYYHYVEVLIRDQASQSEIDAATEEWRRLFPLSDRVDPRKLFRNRVVESD